MFIVYAWIDYWTDIYASGVKCFATEKRVATGTKPFHKRTLKAESFSCEFGFFVHFKVGYHLPIVHTWLTNF